MLAVEKVCVIVLCVWMGVPEFPQVPAQDPALWGLTTTGAHEPQNNQAQSLGFCWGEVLITVLQAREVSKLPQIWNVIN